MGIPVPLKRYKKNFEHSYTLGVFPTLELLTHRRQDALGVLIHPRGSQNAGVIKIEQICRASNIPIETHQKAFSRLGARQNDYAAGVFRKTVQPLRADANHVVLVNPGSMGNLGSIVRTMLGFGFYDLAIIEPAADIYHPDTLRAAMGATFQLRFEHFVGVASYRTRFPRACYALMTDGETLLPETSFETPFGLIFGNESSGLPPAYHSAAHSVRIPHEGAIDSLNLAVSVGVTLYQATVAQEP